MGSIQSMLGIFEEFRFSILFQTKYLLNNVVVTSQMSTCQLYLCLLFLESWNMKIKFSGLPHITAGE